MALQLQGPGVADPSLEHSVFVGDLSPEVSDFVLSEAFRQYYSSVTSAKVITDPSTGRSKGYGFVRFSSEPERDRALEMQGFNLGGRPIRVSLATARRNGGGGGGGAGAAASAAPHPADLDPTNTTLFIGGLSAGVSEDQLRALFGQFGDIVYTKIPAGKGCGFVQFVDRPAAEIAMASLNGQVIGANAIRISWGRSTSRAPSSARAAAAAAGLGGRGGGAGAAAPAAPQLGALGAGGAGMYGLQAPNALGVHAHGGLGQIGFANGFGAPAGLANGAAGMLGQAYSPAGFVLPGAPHGGFAPAHAGLLAPSAAALAAAATPQHHAAFASTPLAAAGGGAGAGLLLNGYGLGGGQAGGLQYTPAAAAAAAPEGLGAFVSAAPGQQLPPQQQQLLLGGAYVLPQS